MIYIPIKYVKPGMVLAKNLPSGLLYFPLICEGSCLTEASIRKLAERGIAGVFIKNDLCDNIQTQEFIEPELKQELLLNTKKIFSDISQHHIITSSIYKEIFQTATNLISYILDKDEFLINMIDIRDFDSYTYSHSLYVGLISALIGIQLELSRDLLQELTMAGLLHDIGKLDISSAIINKPGKLTDEEFDIIKLHPHNAASRLMQCNMFSDMLIKGIESHHEKYDGTGYAKHLHGEQIPLFGRIIALADVYDALVSKRSYRDGWSCGKAIEYMFSLSGTHFDPEILQCFLCVVSAYPVGSIVQLSNGSIGAVSRNTPGNCLRPTVVILRGSEMNVEVDLANDWRYLNVTVLGDVDDYGVLLESEKISS